MVKVNHGPDPTLIIVGFELKHIELQKDRWKGMPSRATYRRPDWNIMHAMVQLYRWQTKRMTGPFIASTKRRLKFNVIKIKPPQTKMLLFKGYLLFLRIHV